MIEMDREEAIEYLQRKCKIRPDKVITEKKPVRIVKTKLKKVITHQRPKFNTQEETKIQKVMKEGKIYGDPFVILND